MEVISSSKGVGGQLSSFRKLVNDSKKITFVGTPGFCTPFAELMSYVLRGTNKELSFIPNLDMGEARSIVETDLGMQMGNAADPSADAVVLLGGLAIPKMGIAPQDMNEMVHKLLVGSENKLIIGVCFQSVFQEQKWTDHIGFDYIIDSDMSVDAIEV